MRRARNVRRSQRYLPKSHHFRVMRARHGTAVCCMFWLKLGSETPRGGMLFSCMLHGGTKYLASIHRTAHRTHTPRSAVSEWPQLRLKALRKIKNGANEYTAEQVPGRWQPGTKRNRGLLTNVIRINHVVSPIPSRETRQTRNKPREANEHPVLCT